VEVSSPAVLRVEFALCANSAGLYPTISQAYRRSFAQQNSILKPAGLETRRGNERCWIQARSFAQQNSILKPAGLETTCRGGPWGRRDVNERRYPPTGEGPRWIQARSFAQQNSILKPAGLETACRGGPRRGFPRARHSMNAPRYPPSGEGERHSKSRSFAQQNSILKPAGLETPPGE
jgi:hypothetical protein